MSEVWLNEAVHLSNGVWCNVESATGMLRAAALRTGGVTVPMAHGEISSALMLYGPGTVTLPLRVFGVNRTTGAVTGDGVADLEANLRYLSGQFHKPTVLVDHVYSASLTKRASCRLRTEPFEASREMTSPPTAVLAVSLNLPGAFWRDVDPVTTPTYSLTSGATQALPAFAGSDAPIDDLIIRIGPSSNPRIYHADDTVVFGYDGIIPAGCQLVVDVANHDLSQSTGFTPNPSLIRYTPYAKWFQLEGGPVDPAPTIRLTFTSGGTAALSFTGRRAYRAG